MAMGYRLYSIIIMTKLYNVNILIVLTYNDLILSMNCLYSNIMIDSVRSVD